MRTPVRPQTLRSAEAGRQYRSMALLPRSIGSLGGGAKHFGKSLCALVGAVEGEATVDCRRANRSNEGLNTHTRASRRNGHNAAVPNDPGSCPQVEGGKSFDGASTAKDVEMRGVAVLGPEGQAKLASFGSGGVCGPENVPRVNTGAVNLDILSSNLELLRRMEESVLGLRTVALSKRRKVVAAESDEENDAHFAKNPRARMREICSKMRDLSDDLLVGLGKIGMANTYLKPRLFKHTLDYGYVFREKAIQNVWHYVHDLGISEEDVLHMFAKDPLFASRSFPRNVALKIKWLESLGVDRDLVVHKWLARADGFMFRCSLCKLEQNYAWLENLGLSKDERTSLLIKCPRILQKDIPRLDEKLLFAVQVLGKDIYDLVRWPTYFTYSFQDRIVLRTAFCSFSGIDFKQLAIPTLFSSSDAHFLTSKRHRIWGDVSKEMLIKSYVGFRKAWAGMNEIEKFAKIGEGTKENAHAVHHQL